MTFFNIFLLAGGCTSTTDIMFLVDSSGSIKETNPADWDLVLGFLRDAIRGLASLGNDIRFSIVTFSYEARLVFDLTHYTRVDDVINAVADIPYIGSTTDITDGLRMVRNSVIPGARPGATRILILMTDGKPNEQVKLVLQYIKHDTHFNPSGRKFFDNAFEMIISLQMCQYLVKYGYLLRPLP